MSRVFKAESQNFQTNVKKSKLILLLSGKAVGSITIIVVYHQQKLFAHMHIAPIKTKFLFLLRMLNKIKPNEVHLLI